MSLIDEALKRARQEAARQDEAARELRYRQVPVIPGLRLRQPARRSWLLLVVIAACLIVGIGIGLGLTLVRGGGEDQRAAVPPPARAPIAAPAPVQVAVPAPPAEASSEEAEPPAIEEQPEKPAPVASAPPAAPVQESAPAAPAPTPTRQEPTIAEMRQREIALNAPRPRSAPAETRESEPAPALSTPAPAAPAPTPSAPEPAAPVAATEPGQVRTYQQEVPLAGGGTLRLNGIAFSEQQPVALFGGKVVALGESVAGYKVVAIEPRRVRLEGQGGVVVVEMP